VRLRLAAHALLGLGAFTLAGAAPPARPPFAAVLDRELRAIAEDGKRPLASLSVLAIRDGRVVYEAQFGRKHIANATSLDRRADHATMYRIASISKLVTALAVMKLVEEGRLALDTDIGEYLGYPVRNPHFADSPITLRMLLSHTSSLRDDGGYFWPAGNDLRDVLTPGGSLHGTGAMWAANAKPGAYFSYANLPWGVIGTVLEKVSGERFDRLMKRLVLDPLGLHGGFNPAEFPPQRVGDIATLYRKRATVDGKETWNPQGPWIAQVDDYSSEAPVSRAGNDYVIGSNGTLFGPQGNLRASAADLGRIMRMLLNRGELEGRRVLAASSVDTMLSRQWRNDGGANGNRGYGSRKDRFNAWGLGNQHFLDVSGPGSGDRLVEGGGFTAVGHLGDAWGLSGAFAFDPATRNGMIFLAGGTGFDPETDPGRYSSLSRYEEIILTALHRRAILGKTD
jgi:CubicO group peptidase (beta-lactamase class C family)